MGLLGGLFDLSSSSEAQDQRVAATDQALVSYGKSSQAGTINVGSKGTLNTGLQATVQKGGTLVMGDTGDLLKISDTFAKTVQDVSATQAGSLNTALQEMGNQLKDALSKVTTLAESGQTGGDSGRNQIILWVVLGVLGLLAFVFYYRR